MKKSAVFYAWQDDHPGNLNRNFIHGCLERAIKDLNRQGELYDLAIDRDTRNVAGMPDIGQTVLQKIEQAAVVVADLTIINPIVVRRSDERPVSNPNVLFELGYALGALGSHRLIGVINTAFGAVEELPFDLRPKRIMSFTLSEGEDKKAVRSELVTDLAKAIDLCLGETGAERIRRNSAIVQTLVELSYVGLEIEEWQGVPRLPQMLDAMRTATEELCRHAEAAEFTQAAQNICHNLFRKMNTASQLALNEDNWPAIKDSVRTAGELAGLLNSQLSLRLDEAAQHECITDIRLTPENINRLRITEPFSLRDLDDLSAKLRKWSFFSLIPEHPAFTERLKSVTFDLRVCVLRWAKNKPTNEDVRSSLEEIERRLADLIAEYCPVENT